MVFHQMIIKFNAMEIARAVEKVGDFKLKIIIPSCDGLFAVLDYENKKYNENDKTWHIPCSVLDKNGTPIFDYYVILDDETKAVSLRKLTKIEVIERFYQYKEDIHEIPWMDNAEETDRDGRKIEAGMYGPSDIEALRDVAEVFLEGYPNMKVRDLGGGTGKAAAVFSLYSRHVIADEIDPRYIERGRKCLDELGRKGVIDRGRIDFRHSDYFKGEVDFSEDDLIYSFWPAYDVNDKERFRRLEKKLTSQMKPGAIFVLYDSGNEITSPDFEEITDSGLVPTPFLKAYRKKPVRVELLKEYVKKKTGSEDIVRIEFPDESEKYYLAFGKMLRALEEGKIVSLDLRSFENADTDKSYKELKNLFGNIGGDIGSKLVGKREGLIEFSIFEILKNAFYHGNKLDFSLPIFIHMDFDDRGEPKSLQVYDAASGRMIPDEERKKAEGILHGRGQGVKLTRKEWTYSRGEITHTERGVIGTHATLFCDKEPLSLSSKKPSGDIQEKMSYGWVSERTGISVRTRGFDEREVDGFKVNAGFIFSDPLIMERIRSSGVFSGYDLRELKEMVLYNAFDESYGELNGRVKLVRGKNALWIPIKDPQNAYTDIAKALWQIVQPKRQQYRVEEWDTEGKALLEARDPEMIGRIERCIVWEWQTMDPDYLFAGRSMWLRLKKPIEIGGSVFKYVKIKGITYRGVFPFSSEEYEHGPRLIWRADESGRIISPTQTNILGTMSREKAKREFDVMNAAFADEVSGACGIARGIFPGMGADGKDAGFIVMLVPEAPEMTLEQLIFNHLPEIEAQAKAETLGGGLAELVGEMKSFIFNHGIQVRRGNDAGYFFGYPHHGNCIRYSGANGFEFRMKDFESAEIIDRKSNRDKMIAVRFIDVFQAIQHYRDFLSKHPNFVAVSKKAGFEPIRVFLDGYFSDRKDDPRIDLLYEALNSEDPYRPGMNTPVADAEHPAIDLIKDVEHGIPHQVPAIIGDMHVVWSGEHKKKGLRVACVQIDMGPFEEDTERMAKIVRSLKVLGDNAPDLVIFPEEIRLKKDRPGREQPDVGTAKEGGLEERTKAIERVAREMGIAIGFCVSSDLQETYYTIVQPEGDRITRERFTKMHYDKEKRVFTVKTPGGEYKIAVLICVECSRMLGLKDDPQVRFRADDLADEIRDADLLIVPSAMDTKTTNWVARRLFEKFNNTPTVVLNSLSYNANKPVDECTGGGNSVFVSQETGKTVLPFEEGFFEGIIMADVSKAGAWSGALRKLENTLFTRGLNPEVYGKAIEELINITKKGSELIPGTLQILERVFLNPKNIDAAVFSEKLNKIATTLLLHFSSVVDEGGPRLSLRHPGKIFVNILYKAELPPYLRPTLMSIFEGLLLADTGFARQAVECIKATLQEDTSSHEFNETAFELLKRIARVRSDLTFSVCAVLVDMLKKKDLDPHTYKEVANCLVETDPSMSYLAENYTIEEARDFILDFLETVKLYGADTEDYTSPHRAAARTIVEPLALTKPEIFDEDMLLKMAGHYPESELVYVAFYVTARIGRIPENERLSDLLRKSNALADNAPGVHERVKDILGEGRKRVLIYQGIKDGLGDELVRVSTLAQALLDYNPELEIVLYTARPYLYDNERVVLKDARNGLEGGDEEFDMVVDFSDPRENYLGLDPLDKMSYKAPNYSIVNKVKTRIYCRQEKIYRWRYTAVKVDGMWVNVREGRQNVYDPCYRLCARLGLPFKVGMEGPRSLFLGVEDEECNRWRQDNVTAKNIEKRRIAVLNGFGGENEKKGFTDKKDYADAVKNLIDQGYFVIIPPNGRMTRDGTPYGTEADARKVLEMLDERDQQFVAITPEPQEMPKLFKHVAAKSDFIVTVEGGMMHLAYNLGKPILVLQMPGSGDFSRWLSYAVGTGQEALTQYGEFADRLKERDEGAKKDSPGLIGKWQITSDITFIPDEKNDGRGVLRFDAVDIAHPKRGAIEIQIKTERAPPELFNDFKRFGPDHKELDEALGAYHGGFEGETFIIESNDFGIEGIGTSRIRAVLRPIAGNRLAKFHELAHAFISSELLEKGESALLDYIISKLVYEGLTGEQALSKYLEKKADKYNIPENKGAREEWKKSWRVHYALRLFQRQYAKQEDEKLESEIRSNAPDGVYPPHYPPDYIRFKDSPSEKLHGELPVEMEILDVKRQDPLIEPDKDAHEYVLNAGVMALSGTRLLFNRIADEIPEDKNVLRRSRVGISVHDKNTGEVIRIDTNMLIPEDEKLCAAISEKGNEIVALEDPRVIERDGTIYVFLTAVKRNGRYFSAVTTHDTEEFLNKLKARREEGRKIEWGWTPLEKLINSGSLKDQNIKNAVPFGNPANGYWYLTFRPEEAHRSQIWLARTRTENGLSGPWEVVGPYLSVNYPGFHWLGSSAYVADIPAEELHGLGLTGFDLKLIHAAAGVGDEKYYDIRLLLTDRKDPTKKYASEPILKPEKGCPYELGDLKDCWKPGVIYSCGAILNGKPEYDFKNNRYIFNIDVYYSGSDTAMLWATVKVAIRYKGDEEEREALTRETKRISSRLPRAEPREEGPVEVKAEEAAEVKVEVESSEDRVVVSNDNVMITRRGTHYLLKLSEVPDTEGYRQGIILTRKIGPKRKDKLPDLMIYSIPMETDGSRREIRGIYIHPDLRGKGLVRSLLNIFFKMYPDVRCVHPNFASPAVLGLLEREYGFRPEEDTEPNVWYESIGEGFPLSVQNGKRYHMCFKDDELRRRFIDVLPADEISQYQVVAVGDEIKAFKTDDFHPVCLFSRHDLKDSKKFEKALESVPVEVWGRTEKEKLLMREGSDARIRAHMEKYPLLRDISDPEKLATNLVEMVVDNTLSNKEHKPFPKKLILAFSKDILSKRALAVFKGLMRLKEKPQYKKLLQNLEIIIEPTDVLVGALADHVDNKDSLVFMFAEESSREELSRVETHENVNASYIRLEGEFPPDYYYPLAEIVTIALARYMRKDCLAGFSDSDLERINLKSKPEEEGGVLIFTVLPKMGRYDYNHQMDRYVVLARFLKAA